jgi:hypothetical protein
MPAFDYFAAAATATVIKAPAAVAADASGAGVDINNYTGDLLLVSAIFNTAGTNPTLATKFQASNSGNFIESVAFAGTGNGTITEVVAGPDAVAENITVTFSNATTAAVVGCVSGALGNATVGTKFSSAKISFLLTAGSTAFINTDAFTVATLAQTYSDITGATIANPGAVKTIARTVVNSDKIGRYIRPVFDIGGTDNPSYLVGITAYGMQN